MTSGATRYYPSSAHANFREVFEDRDYRIKNAATYLLCYSVRYAKLFGKHVRIDPVHTASDFGPDQLETRKERELCVPTQIKSGL